MSSQNSCPLEWSRQCKVMASVLCSSVWGIKHKTFPLTFLQRDDAQFWHAKLYSIQTANIQYLSYSIFHLKHVWHTMWVYIFYQLSENIKRRCKMCLWAIILAEAWCETLVYSAMDSADTAHKEMMTITVEEERKLYRLKKFKRTTEFSNAYINEVFIKPRRQVENAEDWKAWKENWKDHRISGPCKIEL